jgi:D-inositol-3-phosphate glycosyltransferase
MRILWIGDAACETGFARCTHNVCNHLHNLGHEVHILGINYHGEPHQYPYPIYPCFNPAKGGTDVLGCARLPRLMQEIGPDVVVLLNDPWNIPGYAHYIRKQFSIPENFSLVNMDPLPPLIGWLAVDGKNQKGWECNDLTHVATWTQFGADELVKGGYNGPTSIVPLGVDLGIYQPKNQLSCRKEWFPEDTPEDVLKNSFVVGVVGRNQERKRIDLCMEYFVEWIRSCNIDNAYLYLHVSPTGDKGIDIRQMAKYYGSTNRIILNDPPVGYGPTESQMSSLYSSFDVLLTCTQGEGWGLPMMEAMACGVPVIAPDWSALGEWARDAAYLVPCDSTALTSPGLRYTVGGVPNRADTIAGLDFLYNRPEVKQSSEGLELVSQPQYRWRNIASSLLKVMSESVARD